MAMNQGKFVCSRCFNDEGLRDFIKGIAVRKKCSFCGAKGRIPIAAPIEDVLERIKDVVFRHYDDPANVLPYESAEGGYQGTTYYTEEVLEELELQFPKDKDGRLRDVVINELGNDLWCEAEPFRLSPFQQLEFSWREFCEIVKFKYRYFFSNVKRDEDGETFEPAKILELIFSYAADAGMFVLIPQGSRIFRARFQPKGSNYKTALALGPPDTNKSVQTNRMSPPGIVMFYAADDRHTALSETFHKPGTYAIGEFSLLKPVRILDLTRLPDTPSLFTELSDTAEYDPRPRLNFLRHVSREISKPIARDDRVHIEYVPTQIVTEYVRTIVRIEEASVDGIRYRSSRPSGGTSLVLFADQENLVLEEGEQKSFYHLGDRWIELIGIKRRNLKEAP